MGLYASIYIWRCTVALRGQGLNSDGYYSLWKSNTVTHVPPVWSTEWKYEGVKKSPLLRWNLACKPKKSISSDRRVLIVMLELLLKQQLNQNYFKTNNIFPLFEDYFCVFLPWFDCFLYLETRIIAKRWIWHKTKVISRNHYWVTVIKLHIS